MTPFRTPITNGDNVSDCIICNTKISSTPAS